MDDGVLQVVCLCAAWCGVCRDYAAPFGQVALAFGEQARFTQLDIENFPTLLIARGAKVLFFGTITPHTQTLTRLVQGALAGELRPLADVPEIDALAQRLHAALAPRSGSRA